MNRSTAALVCVLVAAGFVSTLSAEMTVKESPFGKLADGTPTRLYTCTNSKGLTVKLTDYGAAIVAVEAPDRSGKKANVTLGFEDAAGYERHGAFFGCTVGRYANRIARGRFTLDGKEYELATNNGENHLHGGLRGFNRAVWKSTATVIEDAVSVTFTYTSADGEEGYPGKLDVTVDFTLNEKNELTIDYTATTDKKTVVNLTNHAYWNLAGAGSGDVLGHRMMVAADRFLAVDKGLIPTGELTPVKGTPLDFTEPHTIGARIAVLKEDPEGPKGYDHCYALRGEPGKLRLAARVVEPESGRAMEIRTTEPGIQLYTGNFLDGDEKNGGHQQHGAFCLETQHYPDSPNRPDFPTTVLKPGDTFRSTTVHRFVVVDQ